MNCSNCGSRIPDGGRFCPSCGAAAPPLPATTPATPAVAPQMAAVPAPSHCPNCGAAVASGRRFCTSCGHAIGAQPAAAGAPPALTPRVANLQATAPPGAMLGSLQPLEIGAVGGLALAVIGTVMAWVKISAFGQSESANAWEGGLAGDLQLGHWLGAPEDFPVEALVIIGIAILGLGLVAGPLMGMRVAPVPFALAGLGAGLGVLGVLNYLYINDQLSGIEGAGVSAGPSIGVYALILGGAVTAVCGFLLEQRRMAPA